MVGSVGLPSSGAAGLVALFEPAELVVVVQVSAFLVVAAAIIVASLVGPFVGPLVVVGLFAAVQRLLEVGLARCVSAEPVVRMCWLVVAVVAWMRLVVPVVALWLG